MHTSPPTGIYRFAQTTVPTSDWAQYLRALGFSSVAGSGGETDAAWRERGFEVEDRRPLDPSFASAVAHLFTAAQSDEEYAAILREFTGETLSLDAARDAGLIAHEALFGAGVEPVAHFHQAAESRDDAAPLPGIATERLTGDGHARLLAAVGDPVDWRQRVLRWKEYARDVKAAVGDAAIPTPELEYRLYQGLLAAWPLAVVDLAESPEVAEALIRRTLDFAGSNEAPRAFAQALFADPSGRFFRLAFYPFANGLVERAAALSLAALVLQCTSPGVPEITEGAELWTPTPEGTHPDAARRAALLAATGSHPTDLVEPWRDSRVKLFILRELLHLRTRLPQLFAHSEYRAQKARGKFADCCVAFTRECPDYTLLVVVPRQVPPLAHSPIGPAWEKTVLEICGILKLRWRNVFTGAESTGPYIPLSDAFQHLPVAVFLARDEDAPPVVD